MLALLLATAIAAAPTLDDRTFDVTMTGPEAKIEKDTLIFTNGTFRSTACDEYGFTAAPYTVKVRGDGSLDFQSDATSPAEGTMRWKGSVRGGQIDGTAFWSKAGQAPTTYTFTGKARARPPGS